MSKTLVVLALTPKGVYRMALPGIVPI
jgi:hypothetical protein